MKTSAPCNNPRARCGRKSDIQMKPSSAPRAWGSCRTTKYTAFVKRECETCQLVVPALQELARHAELSVFSQDVPGFPEAIGGARDDRDLEHSFRAGITTVPTLIAYTDEITQTGRTEGWDRDAGQALTRLESLGSGLKPFQPGGGSRTEDPGMPERLALKFGTLELNARTIEVEPGEDAIEVTYDRGGSDGLPVVPPTEFTATEQGSSMSITSNFAMRDPTAELSPVLRERQAPLQSLTKRKVALLSISKERSDELSRYCSKQPQYTRHCLRQAPKTDTYQTRPACNH